MSDTHVRCHIKASRERIYKALVDPNQVAVWMVPDGMTSYIHEFEPREGGRFRISLTYDSPDPIGKSDAHTDTFHGRFVKLVPPEELIESVEFESPDPAMCGAMMISFALRSDAEGTELVATHTDVPAAISPLDNQLGWQMSLEKLKVLVETTG